MLFRPLSGFQMPAWFDLMSLDPNGVEDDKGIQKSKAIIVKLIEEEISCIMVICRFWQDFV